MLIIVIVIFLYNPVYCCDIEDHSLSFTHCFLRHFMTQISLHSSYGAADRTLSRNECNTFVHFSLVVKWFCLWVCVCEQVISLPSKRISESFSSILLIVLKFHELRFLFSFQHQQKWRKSISLHEFLVLEIILEIFHFLGLASETVCVVVNACPVRLSDGLWLNFHAGLFSETF